ncbi:MAG: hypothetical protein ABW136_10760 [Steroidobacteraceae bacterium]
MTTITRASGVTIEFEDGTLGTPSTIPVRPATRAGAAPGASKREDAVLIAALRQQGVELADVIPVAVKPVAATRAGPRDATSVVRVNVPLKTDESAVVLLDEGGQYRWIVSEAAPATRSLAPSGARSASFSIAVAAAAPSNTRGFIGGTLLKGAIAYVLKFVVKAGAKLLIGHLERDVTEGLVRIDSANPETWKVVDPHDVVIAERQDRAPRVLLFVHGTFSSTVGSFGALGATAEGQAFLNAAFANYEAVLGFDHRTLSVDPAVNAKAILAALRAIDWPTPPSIDLIAYSRGGLVARSLLEQQLPPARWPATLGPAVFVACTNGGTQLANADQWKHFADHYTNLALGALRVGGLAFGAAPWTAVAAGAIRGVGILVKALAGGVLEEGGIPGLGAMQPDGEFVKAINRRQDGQIAAADARWYAITSNFEPGIALNKDTATELPRKWLEVIKDAVTDAVYGEDNDLVVHVRAMTLVDGGDATFFKGRHDYGTNGEVYHTNYFTRAETAKQLSEWLLGGASAPRLPGRGRGVVAAATRSPAAAVAPETREIQEGADAAARDIDALLTAGAVAPASAPTAVPARRKAKKKAKAKSKPMAKAKAKSKARVKAKARTKSKAKNRSPVKRRVVKKAARKHR